MSKQSEKWTRVRPCPPAVLRTDGPGYWTPDQIWFNATDSTPLRFGPGVDPSEGSSTKYMEVTVREGGRQGLTMSTLQLNLSRFCHRFVTVLSPLCHRFVTVLSPVFHRFVTETPPKPSHRMCFRASRIVD